MVESTKQIKLKWPEHLWLAVSNKAAEEGTSIQTIITEAFLYKYGVPFYRTKDKTAKMIAEIMKKYDYVPNDIKEAIERAKKTRAKYESMNKQIHEDLELELA
jgi:hypothetical protein